MKVGIRSLEFPPFHGLPVRGNFKPCCVALQGISQRQLKNHARWRGRILHKYCSRSVSVEIVVCILEESEVHVQFLGYQSTIAKFRAEQLFRRKILASDYAQINCRVRLQQKCKLEVLIQTRRRADSPRNRCPEGLMRRWRPQ